MQVTDGVTVVKHECVQPPNGWTAPRMIDQSGLVMVRRGGFRRRLDGDDAYIGPSMAFFESRGSELQTAHPHDDGDRTTLFFFTDDALERLTGDQEVPTRVLLTSGPSDLAHRRLLAALEQGTDQFEGEERVVHLVGELLEEAAPGRLTTRRSATAEAHHQLVDTAKEAIVADPVGSDLPTLAELVGYSPFHVSRTFRRAAGMTLTRFRNRVRAAMALERLEGGERDLANLALDLGFTDQAHMTRVVRAELGESPGRVRRSFRAV